MLVLKYEKVELKKYSDVSKEKLNNYTIKYLNNTKESLVLVKYMEYPKDFFDTKNKPIYLNET